MTNLFQKHKTTNHSRSQNFYMAELNLEPSDRRFSVDWAGDEPNFEVYIFDNALPSDNSILYTIQCNDEASAKMIYEAMENEVGYWDVEDYYDGDNPRRDYEIQEMEALKAREYHV